MRLGQDLSDITDEELGQTGAWKAWPAAWYRMMIDNTDYLPTKAGDGKCLHLTLLCLDQGPYFNKTMRDFLTLEHPNDDTRKIARVVLKQIAIAVGFSDPNNVEDSDQLVGKAMMVRVYVQKARDEKYGDADGNQNQIGEYMHVDTYVQKHGGKEAQPTRVTPNPAAGQMDPNAEAPF